jgi:hypothetical protein
MGDHRAGACGGRGAPGTLRCRGPAGAARDGPESRVRL